MAAERPREFSRGCEPTVQGDKGLVSRGAATESTADAPPPLRGFAWITYQLPWVGTHG